VPGWQRQVREIKTSYDKGIHPSIHPSSPVQSSYASIVRIGTRSGKSVDLSKSHGVHTVASVLKLFLAELADPLLTYELMDCFMLSVGTSSTSRRLRCSGGSGSDASVDASRCDRRHGRGGHAGAQPQRHRELRAAAASWQSHRAQAPRVRASERARVDEQQQRAVLMRLVGAIRRSMLLKRISDNSSVNNMTATNLATCLAPVMVRRQEQPTDVSKFLEESKKGVKFVEALVNQFHIIFPVCAADLRERERERERERAS